MIPFTRPLIPTMDEIMPFYQASLDANHMSNFGPCFTAAVSGLKQRTGGFPLPVSNGTVAISVALRTLLGPKMGLRVAVPDFTCVATLMAIVQAGMRPVLVDCHESTMAVNPYTLIESRDRYDAFVVVSPFGYAVDFKFYERISLMLSKPLVFDLAGAWGIDTKDITSPYTYSFHATKNFSIGEGGAVVFQSDKDWQRAKQLINFDMDDNKSSQSQWGLNGKLDEIHCAMICAHLSQHDRIEHRIKDKVNLTKIYENRIPCKINHGYYGGAPSMAVLSGVQPDIMIKAARSKVFASRKYYSPLISKMDGLRGSVERLGICGEYFETFLALPTGVDAGELDRILNDLGV